MPDVNHAIALQLSGALDLLPPIEAGPGAGDWIAPAATGIYFQRGADNGDLWGTNRG